MSTGTFFNILTHTGISQVPRCSCYNVTVHNSLICLAEKLLSTVWEQSCATPASLSSTLSRSIPVLKLLSCYVSIILLHNALWEVSGFFFFKIPFWLVWGIWKDSIIQLHLHVYFTSKYPLHFHIFSSSFFTGKHDSYSTRFHRMWKENKSDSIAVLDIQILNAFWVSACVRFWQLFIVRRPAKFLGPWNKGWDLQIFSTLLNFHLQKKKKIV